MTPMTQSFPRLLFQSWITYFIPGGIIISFFMFMTFLSSYLLIFFLFAFAFAFYAPLVCAERATGNTWKDASKQSFSFVLYSGALGLTTFGLLSALLTKYSNMTPEEITHIASGALALFLLTPASWGADRLVTILMSAIASLIGWGLLNLFLIYILPIFGDNTALRLLTFSSLLFVPSFLGTYIVKKFDTPLQDTQE
jgi:hypothetical protein